MIKEGFKFKVPDMSNVTQGIDRARNLPEGEFVCEVYKCRPKVTRANACAIIIELRVTEIVHQEPAVDKKTGNSLPAIVVGQRVDHYLELGGQYAYGEQEWAAFMDALGVPVAERNVVQDAFLGEDNAAAGQLVRVRRQPPKTFFHEMKKAVAAA